MRWRMRSRRCTVPRPASRRRPAWPRFTWRWRRRSPPGIGSSRRARSMARRGASSPRSLPAPVSRPRSWTRRTTRQWRPPWPPRRHGSCTWRPSPTPRWWCRTLRVWRRWPTGTVPRSSWTTRSRRPTCAGPSTWAPTSWWSPPRSTSPGTPTCWPARSPGAARWSTRSGRSTWTRAPRSRHSAPSSSCAASPPSRSGWNATERRRRCSRTCWKAGPACAECGTRRARPIHSTRSQRGSSAGAEGCLRSSWRAARRLAARSSMRSGSRSGRPPWAASTPSWSTHLRRPTGSSRRTSWPRPGSPLVSSGSRLAWKTRRTWSPISSEPSVRRGSRPTRQAGGPAGAAGTAGTQPATA